MSALASAIGLLVTTVVFATGRVAGMVLTSPFPGEMVGTKARVGLTVVLACLVAPTLKTEAVLALRNDLPLAAAREVMVGLVVGFTFRLALNAADVLGTVLSQATGLATPTLMNPTGGEQETVLTRVVTLTAMLIALSVGAHRLVLGYLLRTYDVVPLGAALDASGGVPVLVQVFSKSITLGVTLGLPATAIGLLSQIGLAMVARAAPSLQLFNVGFAVLLVSAFLVIQGELPHTVALLSDHFGRQEQTLDAVLQAFAHGE